jgi:hypothetical protein
MEHSPYENHYYAFVDLPSKAEADAAIHALNGIDAFGGKLRVNRARKHSRKVDERELHNTIQGQSMDDEQME